MQISKSPSCPALQPLSPPTPLSGVKQQVDDGGSGYTPLAGSRHSPVVQTVVGQLLQRGAPLGLQAGVSGHEINGTASTDREPTAHQRAQALSTYRQLAEQTLEPQGGSLAGIDMMA
ncbi:MAG TPA: hypothetical protein ENI80_04550 [Acidiferrobacteraceae bacterium]|nr:hypothetical protein [Acidiferrobacteraceae bacterium]